MRTLVLFSLATLVACTGSDDPTTDDTDVVDPTDDTEDTTDTVVDGDAVSLTGEAWADNWFAMYIGDTLIVEDSVSITTERSFNAETFTFDTTLPVTASFILRDYKETDSGLEYIGEGNQQMGDGGFIAQFSSDGGIVGVTDSSFVCLTIHTAPLDKSCEDAVDPDTECDFESLDEPDGWMDADFDDSAWVSASEFSEAAVSPKDGYDEITWDSSAALIWGADLETHNTILCRGTIGG